MDEPTGEWVLLFEEIYSLAHFTDAARGFETYKNVS